jgi:hypothetical protein
LDPRMVVRIHRGQLYDRAKGKGLRAMGWVEDHRHP